MNAATNSQRPVGHSGRIVRLELWLSAEQIEMAKQEAIEDAARWGGDPGNWRGVLVGIALNAIDKRLPAPERFSSDAGCQGAPA